MSEAILKPGDKLHVITRRFFENDLRRHFAGQVVQASGDLFEMEGYVFVFHFGVNEYLRRDELRRRVFSLAGAGYVVNRLPNEVDIESLQYRVIDERLVVTDGKEFALDINEFGAVN